MKEKVTAIVLSTLNYKDSDRIFVLFTEEKGVINAIAKNLRKSNSRRSYSLDTLNYVSLTLNYSNSYYFIEEASVIYSYTTIKKSILFLSYAYLLLESTKNLIPENEINNTMFKFLKNTLNTLNTKPTKRTVYLYLKKLLLNAGYWSDAYYNIYPFLNSINTKESTSLNNQFSIDTFFTQKIEEAGDKKLNSKALILRL